ncbi:zip metal ion transporter [Niveomyces insectorum RCEF 264]|uniref:Zip metal ion transporter n=1 Tax=Niveomyces insectorum RCEF 264 TaxID=1081102 RepID=A0A167Y281_9HYPO|nr:zip metal ion transporter [Niveomyces insectorum RCEF 264]
MGGLLLLLALSAIMALASFLAGALPLSMTLTQSQLRLISSIGVGILVGTSLIVIIPEGVEAIANPLLNPPSGAAAAGQHVHAARHVPLWARTIPEETAIMRRLDGAMSPDDHLFLPRGDGDAALARPKPRSALRNGRREDDVDTGDAAGHRHKQGLSKANPNDAAKEPPPPADTDADEPRSLPTFYIGFALVTGFVGMFLIDRLPRHAVDQLQTQGPTTRHISLDNLASSGLGNGRSHGGGGGRSGGYGGGGGSGGGGDDDDDDGDDDDDEERRLRGDGEAGFLGSLTPTPRQSRGLATTVGLVIHAAADGVAMGASAATSDMTLGLVIFVAILVHKAPAAFGLTAVLLKHGLSKRAARGHLVVFSLAAPCGALATYTVVVLAGGGDRMEGARGQWWTGMLLLFSAGTFLYVAMHAMQEEGGHDHGVGVNGYADSLQQRKASRPQMRDTLATIGGMLLPLLTQFGHHH